MDKHPMVKRLVAVLLALGSIALLIASIRGDIASKPEETIASILGAWGVYLVVLENVWNWPIGVISSGFFVVVFANARLFGDAGLNVLYVILGLLGWYWWLRGGKDPSSAAKTELRISSLDARGWAISLAALVVLTTAFTFYFRSINDAAPFLDALTTALSLVAQVLLTRKILENWIFWIVADIIYVPLYISRSLPLTAILYVVFLGLATAGLLEWRRKHRAALEPVHA